MDTEQKRRCINQSNPHQFIKIAQLEKEIDKLTKQTKSWKDAWYDLRQIIGTLSWKHIRADHKIAYQRRQWGSWWRVDRKARAILHKMLYDAARERDRVLFENRELRERIAELEDTLRLNNAEADIAMSYGRNQEACKIAEEIYSRRGEHFTGANV